MIERSAEKYFGYQLFDLGQGFWRIRHTNGEFEGTFREVMKFAAVELGFELEELQAAVIEMEVGFFNAAEFGIMKRFMFCFDMEVKDGNSSNKGIA